MAVTELISGGLTMTVTGPVAPTVNDANLLAILRVIQAMNVRVPIVLVRLRLDSGVEYAYRIEATDGRLWRQRIFFPAGSEPTMTFNVADQWKLSEFRLQRAIRDALVGAVERWAGVTEIICTLS